MALEIGSIISEVKSNQVVALRQIQVLLGHGSGKTIEIYTPMANRSFMNIKDLLS